MPAALTEIGGQPVVPHSMGDSWLIRCGVTLSGTYPAGGDPALAEELEKVLKEQGTGEIQWVDIQGGTGGYVLQYHYGEKKLQVWAGSAAAKGKLEELATGAYPASLTTAGTLRVFAVGR